MAQRSVQQKKGKAAIFNAHDVAAHLGGLKTSAAGSSRWWAGALRIEWENIRRPSGSATAWCSVFYTDSNKVTDRLVLRIRGEGHTGQIMPASDAGLAALVSRSKPNPNVQYKKRDKKPAIQIRKWDAPVPTLEDGVTIKKDESGNDILPDDSRLSAYFRVAELVGEVFVTEASERVDRGRALISIIQAAPKKDGKVSAADVLAAFAAEHGQLRPDLVFVASSDAALVRKFMAPKEYEQVMRGATLVASVHVAPLVQEYLSDKNSKNPGAPLPNPITRISLNFDPESGQPQKLTFFDKSKPFMAEGRKSFETGKVDGVPINAENVHEFVTPRCHIDGIVNEDSVCFSNMGISLPVKMEIVVVDPPSVRSVVIDDVYGDDDDADDGVIRSAPALSSSSGSGSGESSGFGESSSSGSAELAVSSEPAGSPADAPGDSPPGDDMAQLMAEIGVGGN